MFQISSRMDCSRKYLHTPNGWHWRNPCFLLGLFQEGEAKNFLRGTPFKFSEANNSGGVGNFFEENEILTLE